MQTKRVTLLGMLIFSPLQSNADPRLSRYESTTTVRKSLFFSDTLRVPVVDAPTTSVSFPSCVVSPEASVAELVIAARLGKQIHVATNVDKNGIQIRENSAFVRAIIVRAQFSPC